MNTRTWMLIGSLAVMPLACWSQEKPAATIASPVKTVPVLDLRAADVQQVIRNNAELLAKDQPVAEASAARFESLPFRASRRMHHMDCDSYNCVAYTADNNALYTIPREQYFGVPSDKPGEGWLSCQSNNDMLSTFERYDLCRGVSIGIPARAGNFILDLPKIRL